MTEREPSITESQHDVQVTHDALTEHLAHLANTPEGILATSWIEHIVADRGKVDVTLLRILHATKSTPEAYLVAGLEDDPKVAWFFLEFNVQDVGIGVEYILNTEEGTNSMDIKGTETPDALLKNTRGIRDEDLSLAKKIMGYVTLKSIAARIPDKPETGH